MAKGKKKNLVIVESPAKAKTINKYLGPDYEVVASKGHVRDLPKSRFGIDIENGWIPKYLPLKDRKDVLAALKKHVAGAHTVYLAPDPDREGEAIAWHLKEALGLDDEKTFRVTFNEITKRAVQEAFDHAGHLNMDRVAAQEARRFLDRVVGYKLSPLLRKKVSRGSSAGRVQSPAVRLIVGVEGDTIRDISFNGSGCAISKASASLMTGELKGKTVAEAETLFQSFHELVTGPEASEEALEEMGKLAVFSGVRDYPARVKCASLAWHTVHNALQGRIEPAVTE